MEYSRHAFKLTTIFVSDLTERSLTPRRWSMKWTSTSIAPTGFTNLWPPHVPVLVGGLRHDSTSKEMHYGGLGRGRSTRLADALRKITETGCKQIFGGERGWRFKEGRSKRGSTVYTFCVQVNLWLRVWDVSRAREL